MLHLHDVASTQTLRDVPHDGFGRTVNLELADRPLRIPDILLCV